LKPAAFHPEAEAEFDDAADYYESQEVGLGSSFQNEVEEKIWLIRQTPDRWMAVGTLGAQKISLKRFPYSLYYFNQEERIWIIAVAHKKRRPFYWQSRVQGN